METISTVFLRQVMKYQTRPALMVKKEGTYQPLSWQDWYEQVASFGLGLHDLEIGPGDAVAILCNNRPEWMTADLAILGLGAMTIPIYATNTADQAAFILQDARCKAVIVENPDQWQKIALVKNRLTDLNTVIQMDGLPHSTSNRLAFSDVLAKGRGRLKTDPGLFPRLSSQSLPEDICTIVYTSGTTGPPKGAMLSHDNILSVIRMLGRVVPATDRDSYVSFLPLAHVFERIGGFFNGITVGVTIFLAESMDTLARDIQEAKPTILMTVPRLLEKVYATIQNRVKEESSTKQAIFNWSQKIGRDKGRRQMSNQAVPFNLRWKHALAYQLVFKKLKRALGGRIRFLVSAGAPISREIVEFFSAAGLYVMEGYGATETSAPASVNVLDDYRFGTVGKPLPGVEIRIDPLNGEILIKGGNIFKGYHNLPEETAQSFTEDGFFRTGDVGHLDQDGFLVITDRIKDLIITSGGKNVAPQNIENLFKGDPLFSQVVVIGEGRKFLTALFNLDPDEVSRKGKALGLIDPDPNVLLDDPRILSWVRDKIEEKNQHLARYEQIKGFRILKTPFSQEGGELTPTLKLRRKVIMEKHKDLIESMYPPD